MIIPVRIGPTRVVRNMSADVSEVHQKNLKKLSIKNTVNQDMNIMNSLKKWSI